MKHKMVHYKGYFLVALAFISTAAVIGTWDRMVPFPLFALGAILWAIGCAKVAMRNSILKTNRH